MKLISLNTWGGKVFEPLIEFIASQKDSTDIFCFQEIYQNDLKVEQVGNIRANLLGDFKSLLNNYQIFFYSVIKGYDLDGKFAHEIDLDLEFGLAIFVRKSLKIKSTGQGVIRDDHTGILNPDFSNLPVYFQFLDFEDKGKNFTICNFHGIPKPANKLDTPARINQSKKLLEFLSTKSGAKILTGDFNLLPETESIKMLEKNMRNLVREFEIPRTRSKMSPFYGKPDFQEYADYTFVSKDIKVESFEVPDIAVSDHLSMILQFSTLST